MPAKAEAQEIENIIIEFFFFVTWPFIIELFLINTNTIKC